MVSLWHDIAVLARLARSFGRAYCQMDFDRTIACGNFLGIDPASEADLARFSK